MSTSSLISRIKPVKGKILIQPLWEEDQKRQGKIYLPENRRKTYPSSGLVLRTGELKEDIEQGDIILFEKNQMQQIGDFYGRMQDRLGIISEEVALATIRDW